jgi:hypothetical protein
MINLIDQNRLQRSKELSLSNRGLLCVVNEKSFKMRKYTVVRFTKNPFLSEVGMNQSGW